MLLSKMGDKVGGFMVRKCVCVKGERKRRWEWRTKHEYV